MTDPKEALIERLLPCPFCGRRITEFFGSQVICTHCGAGTMVHDNKSEAIAAWNRRALASLSASVGVTDEQAGYDDGDQSGSHAGSRHRDNCLSLPSSGGEVVDE